MNTQNKRKQGRPTLLDPELTKRFCDFIRNGATEKNAAQACGWSYGTYQEWLRRGLGEDERPETPAFASFARAVMEARGHALVLTEAAVRKQHPLPWLYNRDPDQWKPIVPRTSGQEDDESISLSAARKILDEYFESDRGNGNGKH